MVSKWFTLPSEGLTSEIKKGCKDGAISQWWKMYSVHQGPSLNPQPFQLEEAPAAGDGKEPKTLDSGCQSEPGKLQRASGLHWHEIALAYGHLPCAFNAKDLPASFLLPSHNIARSKRSQDQDRVFLSKPEWRFWATSQAVYEKGIWVWSQGFVLAGIYVWGVRVGGKVASMKRGPKSHSAFAEIQPFRESQHLLGRRQPDVASETFPTSCLWREKGNNYLDGLLLQLS